MRKLIKVDNEEGDEEYDECSESFGEEPDEVI
jgi:hypothetical protein